MFIESWGWDQQVAHKSRDKIATTLYVITKSAVLIGKNTERN